jgi:class 3 adenylate cyclase
MEFRILGSFEVIGPAGLIDLRGAKRRGLLACLVVHAGQPMSTDRLVEELWGAGGSEGAPRTVQTYMSQLRKLLQGEAARLVTRPGGYLLEVDPAAVDAHRFEQTLTAASAETDPTRRLMLLDGALALWRGPPLGEFAGTGWADREATRLEARRLHALQRRNETLMDLGRTGEAIAELETLVSVHPLDEGLWAHFMLALYRSGRQADALAAYQRARRHLVDELGIEPGPKLAGLEHRILAQDPTLVVPADSPVSVASGTVTATFLFCDLVGSTELLTRLGDDAGDEVRRECYAVFREALAAHGGREVKSTGDGVFAVFPISVEQAVACGIAMQRGLVRLDVAHPLLQLRLRVGIAMGEARSEDGDWYGTPVVEAERLCTAARGGQILVADVVCTLAGTRGGHSFRSVGALKLKGLARPLPASEVDWSPNDPARPATPALPAMTQQSLPPRPIEVPLPAVVTATRQGTLVGRDLEQERLAGVWAEAKAGRRQLVLMAGEPGIGKSRLAAELAAMAYDDGAVVLWGRCDEGLGVAYQPVAEALRHYVRHGQIEALDVLLGVSRWQLSRLVPELAAGPPDRNVSSADAERLRTFDVVSDLLGLGTDRPDRNVPSTDAETERLRMFDAVSDLLELASRSRPLLLVQDDLHWAAAPTLLLLRHLARPADDRVLMVGAYRDTELDHGHPLVGVLADLRREPTVIRLAVKGLDEKAVAALIEAETGRGPDVALDLASALHAETEGNPFFVRQILGHLAETGALDQHARAAAGAFPLDRPGVPEGVREVIERRLARQPKAVRRVLPVAAVIGRNFTLSVLERIPEIPTSRNALLRALERAAQARLIQEVPGEPGRFVFVHDVVRQTLYDGLSGTRRARLHRSIAETLEERSRAEAQLAVEYAELGQPFVGPRGEPPGADPQSAVLAHHFVLGATAGCRSEAIAWSERAGTRALQQFAFEEAATHFQRAIELLEWDDPPDRVARARLLLGEHDARGAIGDASGAKAAAARAIEDARTVGSVELLVEAAVLRVWWIGTVNEPETTQILEDTLADVDDREVSRRAALLGALAFHRAVTERDPAAAEPLAREAVALARDGDDPTVLADVLAWRAQARVLQGSPDVAAQQADLAELATLPEGIWHRRHGRYGWLDRMAAVGRLQVGDLAGFDAALERVARLGDENQDRFLLAAAATGQGLHALLDGRFGEVEDHAADMLRWAGDDAGAAISHASLLASLWWDQGRLEKLKRLLIAGTEQGPGLVDSVRSALALVYLNLDEPEEARAHVSEIVATAIAGGTRELGVTLAMLAEVCARLGDTEAVAQLITALDPYRGQLIVLGTGSGCLGAADRYLGMLAAASDELAEAERLFESALALEHSVGSAPLASRTRVAHARALLKYGDAGDVRRATQLLDAATETANRLGMVGLVHEIDTLRQAPSRCD